MVMTMMVMTMMIMTTIVRVDKVWTLCAVAEEERGGEEQYEILASIWLQRRGEVLESIPITPNTVYYTVYRVYWQVYCCSRGGLRYWQVIEPLVCPLPIQVRQISNGQN